MDFSFLPNWPLTINHFVLFGAILLAGLVAGQLAHRSGIVPKITGYIAVGLVLGPSVLGVLDQRMVGEARVFVDIALGLILFQLGRELDLRAFRRDRSLAVSSLLEAAASMALVYWVLERFGVPALPAALAGAVAISSSPAVVLLVVRELGAHGPVTQRALNLVALNNVLSFLAFTVLLPWLHYSQHASVGLALLQPVYLLGGSLLLAFALAHVSIRVARAIGKNEAAQFALLVALIVVGVGLAKMVGLSLLLTMLALGIMSRNLDRSGALLEVEFGHGGEIFFIILFVLAGANLHLEDLAEVGWAALAFVVARGAAKLAALLAVQRASRLGARNSAMVGLTLTPMAGLAIGLVQSTYAMYPDFGSSLAAIVLAAVAILETVGPIVTEFALKRSGEVLAQASVEH